MRRMMTRYRAALEIGAAAAELEATARAHVRQLEADTATIELARADRQGATLTVGVELRFQSIGYRCAQNLAPYAQDPKHFVGYVNDLASSSSVVVARASRRLGPQGREA